MLMLHLRGGQCIPCIAACPKVCQQLAQRSYLTEALSAYALISITARDAQNQPWCTTLRLSNASIAGTMVVPG